MFAFAQDACPLTDREGLSIIARKEQEKEVRRVILPERLECGNTAVVPLSPVDSAAWIAPAGKTVPKGGLFLKFRKEFDADGFRHDGAVSAMMHGYIVFDKAMNQLAPFPHLSSPLIAVSRIVEMTCLYPLSDWGCV